MRAASVSIAYEGKADGEIPPPIAMLLEVLVAHAIEPKAALKLIGVNVAKAQRQVTACAARSKPR
jgi:hypothetical protein